MTDSNKESTSYFVIMPHVCVAGDLTADKGTLDGDSSTADKLSMF